MSDWKRIGDKTRTDFFEFSNRKLGQKIAFWHQDEEPNFKWGFEAPGLDREFRTRSEAIKFAKGYMRDNPNG